MTTITATFSNGHKISMNTTKMYFGAYMVVAGGKVVDAGFTKGFMSEAKAKKVVATIDPALNPSYEVVRLDQ
jgi:hypothetical protein